MHKTILKIFGFLKSFSQFIKILLLFCILMLLLYWIQNLAGYNWGWLGFISPLLDGFIFVGELFAKGSVKLFDAVFEYKYLAALVFVLVLYYIDHFAYLGLNALEEAYGDGRRMVKKIEEDMFNKTLQQKNVSEQTRLKKYQIYVGTAVKKKFTHKEFNINLEHQNQIMNKFLTEKTGICPTAFEDGFLYTFNDFNYVDGVLEVFFKLLKADTPLNYYICVQILGANHEKEIKQFKTLISLKLENKISMTSDTAYRYKFNKSHKYGTSQVGLFQKDNDTFEAHEFIII